MFRKEGDGEEGCKSIFQTHNLPKSCVVITQQKKFGGTNEQFRESLSCGLGSGYNFVLIIKCYENDKSHRVCREWCYKVQNTKHNKTHPEAISNHIEPHVTVIQNLGTLTFAIT